MRDEQVAECVFVHKNTTMSAASPPHQEAFWETKPSVCCFGEFTGTRDLVLSPCNPGTSSYRVNWFGQSTWFWLLGKLVPWRVSLFAPPRAGQGPRRDRRNSPRKRMWKQRGRSKYSCVSSRSNTDGLVWAFFCPCLFFHFSVFVPDSCFDPTTIFFPLLFTFLCDSLPCLLLLWGRIWGLAGWWLRTEEEDESDRERKQGGAKSMPNSKLE